MHAAGAMLPVRGTTPRAGTHGSAVALDLAEEQHRVVIITVSVLDSGKIHTSKGLAAVKENQNQTSKTKTQNEALLKSNFLSDFL